MQISVVIPAFNEEKFLRDCLAALKSQTNQPSEIILVDNNSTDQTAAIGQELGCLVVKEEKQGNAPALKKGLDQASGELIAATDADTIVEPDWLEQISQGFADEKVVGMTGPIKIDSTFGWLSSFVYALFLKFNFLIGKPHLVGFNFAVRRSAYQSIGGVDLNYKMSADVDLGLRLKKSGKVVYNPKMTVKTSVRRWQENPLRTFFQYAKGYFYTVWLRRSASVSQEVVR